MVARGTGAAGPVLLACRQWDPLGLARRLPSLGVGAWRCAPLLPWRVQCPVCVCAALAAGSGGFGPVPGVVCSPSSPFPPRVSRVACGGPSRPGVPYPRSLVRHSTWSVCSARSVRLPFWWSPRVLFVCVRSRSRGVRSPLGGVARASRVVPALGAGRAVPCGPCPSACPAPVPCSVWRAWGGAVRSRFPPTWLGVAGAAAGRPRGGAFVRCVGRSGSCVPLPSSARPLGGLSGSALRACGCGGPALFLRGGREVSSWWGLLRVLEVHVVILVHVAPPRRLCLGRL